MKHLALILLLAGCATRGPHHTAPISAPSVGQVKNDIAKARTISERIEFKATRLLGSP